MIKAGFDFGFTGILVAIFLVIFNFVVEQKKKKNKNIAQGPIDNNVERTDLEELKDLFGFSSVLDVTNEDNVDEVIADEAIVDEETKTDFQAEIKQHFNNLSYESIETPVDKEYTPIGDFLSNSKDEDKFSFKEKLKENPKFLIFCSEILKPKYQDF